MAGFLREWLGIGRDKPRVPVVRIERSSAPEERPRQPRPVAQRSAIYRDEYIPREAEESALRPGRDGLPDLRLVRERRGLVLEAQGRKWINPASPALRRLDIHVFKVRGVSYYPDAVREGALSPGTMVRLMREPENEHDANAIAVYPRSTPRCIGYVNKANAKRLAPRMDAGEALVALTTRGSAAGKDDSPVAILVTTPAMLTHLRRK